MAILQKPQPKTPAERIAERQAEIDHNKAMQQQENERRAAKRAEHDAFIARAEAIRREQAAAAAAGEQWVPDEPIPTLRDVWAATRAAELQAKADAEAARIVALTPRELWFSTLPWQDQQKVQTYEKVNHIPYPVPGLE